VARRKRKQSVLRGPLRHRGGYQGESKGTGGPLGENPVGQQKRAQTPWGEVTRAQKGVKNVEKPPSPKVTK